ncbi:MAG: DsbA family protein [Salinibacter sp.]
MDVYADIACPWCYVGRARLKQALAERPDLDVALRWRPSKMTGPASALPLVPPTLSTIPAPSPSSRPTRSRR